MELIQSILLILVAIPLTAIAYVVLSFAHSVATVLLFRFRLWILIRTLQKLSQDNPGSVRVFRATDLTEMKEPEPENE